MLGLVEAEGNCGPSHPWCGAKDAQALWEPQSSGRVEYAGKQSRSRGPRGKLEESLPHHEPTHTMPISPHSWEAGFTLPILEVGKLRFTQVKPFVHRASEGRSHSLDPGMPRSKALFHTTHEARTWGQMGYRDHICQTKNVSTQNDKYTCGCEDSAMERWNVG